MKNIDNNNKKSKFIITLAQLNYQIGNLTKNTGQIIAAIDRAASSDLVIFSELSLCGYPPKDLLNRDYFNNAIQEKLDQILDHSKKYPNLGIVLGYTKSDPESRKLFNVAGLIQNGKLLLEQYKTLLPSYDVFDEHRYFTSGSRQEIITFKGKKIGLAICEDIWSIDPDTKPIYPTNPIKALADKGADTVICIMASPYEKGKIKKRLTLLSEHAKRHRLSIVAVNQVGGNDDLLFDGTSAVIDKSGHLSHISESFLEKIESIDLHEATQVTYHENTLQNIYSALTMGIVDYFKKCGFSKAIIGLSGGIDSSLVATLAVNALGPKNVTGILLPSRYSSEGSIKDAEELAQHLNIHTTTIPINAPHKVIETTLKNAINNPLNDICEQNLQARIRGTLLMALSNQTGALLLTTGNKSEIAVGYCTLYGDMNGGLNPIADLPKTLVYELSKWINIQKYRIPQNTIDKDPSAELKDGQKDQDTLPPYTVLDAILELYIEKHLSPDDIIQNGFKPDDVYWVCTAVDANEYKRFQAAPGLKVTTKAFGSGRKMVISSKNRYT